MKSAINRTEATAARLSANIAHAQRLIVALGGSPEGWAWDSAVRTDPQARLTCACGHSGCGVLYGLEKDACATVWVGSSCINSYAQANPVLVGRIQAHVASLQAEARAQRAAIKAQAADVANEALLDELRATVAACRGYYEAEKARVERLGEWRVARPVWFLSSYGFEKAVHGRALSTYAGFRQHLGLKLQSAVAARLKAAIKFAAEALADARGCEKSSA